MPPPDNGNVAIPFTELMRLERATDDHVAAAADGSNSDTFRSTALPYVPGGQLERAPRVTFGGHVYAQSTWAAAQTIKRGLVLYNITGTFLLFGRPGVPYTYRVQRVRDGRSSAVRIVHATQDDSEGVHFTCTCSFRAEQGSALVGAQDDANLWTRYESVLQAKSTPSEFEPVPGMDVPWYVKYLKDGGTNDEFPGLEMRQADMTAYNDDRHPLDRRLLVFYRPIGEIPLYEPNLHLCAHMYASDRNGLYSLSGILELGTSGPGWAA